MDVRRKGNQLIRELRKIIYSIKKPEFMLFDIDSTLLDTYGNQEDLISGLEEGWRFPTDEEYKAGK